MAPLLRRTWAPRGQMPVFYQRTRSHQKVAVIAALVLSPRRRRVRLFFSARANANVDAVWAADFLRDLRRGVRGQSVVIWDRLNAHRSLLVQRSLARQRRLQLVYLPPYAPELNPVEYLWAHLKSNPLANLAVIDASRLARIGRRDLRHLAERHDLLRSFIHASPLSSCLT